MKKVEQGEEEEEENKEKKKAEGLYKFVQPTLTMSLLMVSVYR